MVSEEMLLPIHTNRGLLMRKSRILLQRDVQRSRSQRLAMSLEMIVLNAELSRVESG